MQTLKPRWKPFMRALTAIAAVLLVLSIAGKSLVFSGSPLRWSTTLVVERLDVDRETSIPTWFSASILLLSAGLLMCTAAASRAAGGRWTRHWAGLAAIFALLSLDEITDLHNAPVISQDAAAAVSPYLYLSWVIPAAVVVVLFVGCYVPFLRGLPRRTSLSLILAGAIYVGGAMVMEAIGANHIVAFGYDNLTMAVLVTLEEGMEIFGVLLLLHTLFTYIGSTFGGVAIWIAPRGGRMAGPVAQAAPATSLDAESARPVVDRRATPDRRAPAAGERRIALHQGGQAGQPLRRGFERLRSLAEREANERPTERALVIEARPGDRRDADLGREPPGELHIPKLRDGRKAGEHVVRPLRNREREPGLGERPAE